MRRITLVITAFAALALLIPTVSLAGGHKGHKAKHKAHHSKRHSHHRSTQTTTTTSTGSTAPTPAGSVDSFDGTTLIIRLADNTTVSGKVTRRTHLECPQTTTYTDPLEGNRGRGRGPGGPGWHDNGDQGNGQGDEGNGQGEQGNGQGDEHNSACSSSSLTQGASVERADLSIGADGAVWRDVELAG